MTSRFSYRFAILLVSCGFASIQLAKAQLGETSTPVENIRANAATVIQFSVPGAGVGAFEGTQPIAINAGGVVAGNYIDSTNVSHGFVRATTGTITPFDATGAGTGAFQGTFVTGINKNAVVVGYFYDTGSVLHGFIRGTTGAISVVDAPGAGTAALQGTQVNGVNDSNVAVGVFTSSNSQTGFLRTPQGVFTDFSVPKASGTVLTGINGSNLFTGYYSDSSFVYQAFAISPAGKFIAYSFPQAPYGDYSFAINGYDLTVGDLFDDSVGDTNGFVGQTDGTTTVFSYPGSTGTHAASINAAGEVTGSYTTATATAGYLRQSNGTMASFQVPPSLNTWPTSINNSASVTGYFQIAGTSAFEGFLLVLSN